MAQRRMFSLEITSSDAFLDMPLSTQALYLHLGMNADDEGFVNPKRIMRMINAADDDLKILLTKRFILPFESGVVVIKHWKINNYLRNDRYKSSTYVEEKNKLFLKENRAYTDNFEAGKPLGIPMVHQRYTQERIDKNRIDKMREGTTDIFYLKNIPLEDIKYLRKLSRATEKQIRDKGEQLYDYCLAKGKEYKNYKSFLTHAIREDYPLKSDFDEKYSLES